MLQGLFSDQSYKARSGYYLNHHQIMTATPENQKKLIFYYIASQLPEKLAEEDAESFFKGKLN